MIITKVKTQPISLRSTDDDISALFHHYTARSGHPDWLELHAEARALADRIRPQLEAPVSFWIDCHRYLRSCATALRNHVANWHLTCVCRHDLWPLYFIWTTHRTCNFRCSYCDDHRGNKYPDLRNEGVLDTKKAIRMLKIMRTRVPSILISGGEPTLRNDLPAITLAARNLNYFPIIVDTNGSILHQLLQKPAWRSWLADIDHIVVSLDSLDAAVLTRMWRYKHPLDVIQNILLLRELSGDMRFKLMINTTIQPDAIHHARDILNWSNDLGICFCPMPVNVGPTIDRSLLDNPDYLDLVKLILKRKREGYRIAGSIRMNERMLTSQTLQCRNTLKPNIDYDGRLFWPCKSSIDVEPVLINTLDFENVELIYRHASNLINPTNFQQRCGAKCNWSQNYTTDAYVYGLRKPFSIAREIFNFLKAV